MLDHENFIEDSEDEAEEGGRSSKLVELLRRAVTQGAEALSEEKLKETVVAEVLRKAIIKKNEVVDSTEDSLRKLITELPLPKEVVDRITGRLDDYKAELFRILKEELHDFLSHIELGYELQKMLTSLSLEIKTEIRFIPNEKHVVKPNIKSHTRVRRSKVESSAPQPERSTETPT